MKTLPDKITVTFTKEDRTKAGPYSSHDNCLMATALKRMGYNHDTPIQIGPCGSTKIGDTRYEPIEEFGAATVLRFGFIGTHSKEYRDSVVGMTVNLVKR